MSLISVLILFPILASLLMLIIRNDNARNVLVRISATVIGLLSLYVVQKYFNGGLKLSFPNEEMINLVIAAIEVVVAVYIVFVSIKNKKYFVTALALIQTPLILWFEFTKAHLIKVEFNIVFDKLSAIMVLIIGIIGSLICVYAVGYMKWYHVHHDKYKDRKPFFFSVLFLFLSAMFGIVLSNSLTWIYFCWELTTLCSFLLIGYTQTNEAKNNAFLALLINLFGGLAFAIGIIFIGMNYNILALSDLLKLKPEVMVLIPVFLFCVAALTKSAQLPFSSWLLGAMVAPTPSSALLHSSTMVKAGVYLLIRLAPLLGTTTVGRIVTLVGGITFLATSLIAITQSDAKKILAYSTIANLGLIVTCASVGTQEALWAAILLLIFHAISKSLLFLTVGSIEHQIGSRNVEDMDILFKASKKLSLFLVIGIAGMFLAPFGMLISKWAAMKAFIDSNNIVIIMILVYGSSATLFYWTKWMGKIISNSNRKEKVQHTFHIDEEIPIFVQAALTVVACFSFPFMSKYAIMPYLTGIFGKSTVMPIGTSDVYLMLIMLSMLVLLPLGFVSIYKKDTRRIVPVYMAGENTGDNVKFHGSLNVDRKAELRNWYMEGYFGNTKLSKVSDMICGILLCIELLMLIWGVML